MKIKKHGFGIVEFQDVIKIDQTFIVEYINFLQEINPSPFEIVCENDTKYALTNSGFKINLEDVQSAPNRYNILFNKTNLKYEKFISEIDQALFRCLLEYCRIFPDAARTIWWKTQGHIAHYTEGQLIGPHSDSHIEFDIMTKNPPHNQASMHNTVSSGLYLNNCLDEPDQFSFSGGEMYFEQADYSFRPMAGSVIMYPSNYIGRHEVKPVTKGNRYVYLQFYSYGYPKDFGADIEWLTNLQKEVLTNHAPLQQ